MSSALGGFIDMPAKNYGRATRGRDAKQNKTTKKAKATNMNKDQYKKTIATHKAEIAKLKAERAKLKGDIKTHKLFMKQAKIVYKLSKIKEQ